MHTIQHNKSICEFFCPHIATFHKSLQSPTGALCKVWMAGLIKMIMKKCWWKRTSLVWFCVISQMEPMGSLGGMFSDLWWRPEDEETDLCEDLSDSAVYRQTCWSPKVWEESVPRYARSQFNDKHCKILNFGVFLSFCICLLAPSWQRNVNVCAWKAVPVLTAVVVCVRAMCCVEKSTLLLEFLW